MQLAIGSAQFGLDYGISNTEGQTSESEVKNILEFAKQEKITVIDTAPGYGSSEEVLGKHASNASFQFISKLSNNLDKLESTLQNSLEKLNVNSLYGLLIHDTSQLQSSETIAFLERAKSDGLTNKIGISVYNSSEIDTALATFKPDIVQLPINILDQRLIEDGSLKKLKEHGVEIHARSIFLQGLLLMDEVPDNLKRHSKDLESFLSFRKQRNLSAIESCIEFVRSVAEIDCLITGVQNELQLKELHAVFSSAKKQELDVFSKLSTKNIDLLNPSNWR